MTLIPTIAGRDCPLLFVDDSGITRTDTVTRIFHPGVTRSTPVLVADGAKVPAVKRFKMLGVGSGGARAAWSADGIHWNEAPCNPVFESDDTITLARHPFTGEYLAYHKRQEMVRGFRRRTIWVSGSLDFETWSPSEPALFPSEEDDCGAGEGERTDLYSMSVFPHATGLLGWSLK